jgi:hypothetical protein
MSSVDRGPDTPLLVVRLGTETWDPRPAGGTRKSVLAPRSLARRFAPLLGRVGEDLVLLAAPRRAAGERR